MPSIEIQPLTAAASEDWNRFVFEHPQGSPFHLTHWKQVMEESFGYKPHYLAAYRQQTLCGVLPLFLIENPFAPKILLSTPFAVYGGALSDSDEVRQAFAERVTALGTELGVAYVELRNQHGEQSLGFSPVASHVNFTGPIAAGEEDLMQSIPRKTRTIIRKSLKQSFSTVRQTEDFRVFEGIYTANLRRLGTPAFPSHYFASLLKHFKGMIDIREVFLPDQTPVAAVMTIYFRNQVLPYYGAASEQHNAQAPSSFLYWDLLLWAGSQGYTFFDFGRSKVESGSGHFKSHWGFEQRVLPYEVLLVKATELPNNTPTNPKFELAIRLWQKLPLSLTKALGPHLIRRFP
jgi:FemAB-related protein (PEP-CTERM system-associated)